MKSMYSIIAVVIVIIISYLLISSSNKRKQSVTKFNDPIQQKENPYRGLRSQMLSLKSSDLNLDLSVDKEVAFGAVLELGTGEGTATIIALMTGDASMYTSSGGGIIGGSQHENVSKAAIDFVNTSQDFFTKMNPADTSLTKTGNIKFYVLTNKGRYSYEGKESELMKGGSGWEGLFDKGNEVITQLRLVSGD